MIDSFEFKKVYTLLLENADQDPDKSLFLFKYALVRLIYRFLVMGEFASFC